MDVQFGSLAPEGLPAVQELLLGHWQRQWSKDLADRIFRWRFIERPADEAIVGWDGDRCVAMVDSCLRPYRIGAETVQVRELGDWFSRPEYRGVGLQPMWMMMRKPEPMIGMGGTRMTRTLLPRMNWKELDAKVGIYVLKLGSGVLVERAVERLRLPGKPLLRALGHRLSVPIRRIRPQSPPGSEARVSALEPSMITADVEPAPGTYAVARLAEGSELAWLLAAPPEMGRFSALAFSLDGRIVGLSISRVFMQGAYRAAYLMHVQAREATPALYAWMVGETSARLADEGVQEIHCRTSCARLKEALTQTAFVEYASLTPRYWPPGLGVPNGSLLLSWLRGDDPLIPYPS